jgi:type II secretory pathway component GspD/PulD (secretin)
MVLVVYPQISSISGFLNVNGAQYPQVVSREAQTSVRLHDKETLVVGGLLSDTESKSLQRIPILGQIPVLGNLFTYREHAKQRTDLIMMITPEVLPLGYQDTNPQLHPETGGPALKLPGY